MLNIIMFVLLVSLFYEDLTFLQGVGELQLAVSSSKVCKDLVVWGSNLTSNVGYPRFSKLVSNIIMLPSHSMSLFVGLILSDGWVAFPSPTNKNARLGLTQSLAHFPYLWFVFTLLSHYCSNYPMFRSRYLGSVQLWSVTLYTRSLPCITLLRALFYNSSGKKILPPVEILYELLTPVALAHWIMGDGAAQSRGGLVLCTESYTIQEVVLLVNVLIIRYDFNCTIRARGNHQYHIYIRASSIQSLQNIVLPYMHKSILYKIRA